MLRKTLQLAGILGLLVGTTLSSQSFAYPNVDYYDYYDAGYFDDVIYDDDWFYDYYDYDLAYDYDDNVDWYDWKEERLFN